MAVTSFCPYCWAEVDVDAVVCPHCHVLLTQDNRQYVEKLIAALHHPEPLTQRRAAYVLGLLRNAQAVPALCALLSESSDPYLQAEAAAALGSIGGPQAAAALHEAAGEALSVIVRRAAGDALTKITSAQRDSQQ